MTDRDQAIKDHDNDRREAFKRIGELYQTPRRRSKERLKWMHENPSPIPPTEQLANLREALWGPDYAFRLGFFERLGGSGAFGRSWENDQRMNEAYDRGMNYAEELFAL